MMTQVWKFCLSGWFIFGELVYVVYVENYMNKRENALMFTDLTLIIIVIIIQVLSTSNTWMKK